MEPEIVIASSPTDAGISCWDLHSGAENLRYRSCSSTPHGLTSVGGRFLASSQLRDSKSSGGSILYWSWNKPQAEVKCFPAEAINPLTSNSEGTYIVGGGISGDIYLWEVSSGKLLKKWHGHYRAITCLLFCDDQSLIISGAEDGSIRIWSLLMIFDDMRRDLAKHIYEYSFSEHTLKVTSIVTGYGGSNAIIITSSEDRTCKVWSLSKGKLLKSIVFPSIIDAIALDPGEHVFYAGAKDGKIYIASVNAIDTSNSSYGQHIIGSLSEHSKSITCLAFSMNGLLLVSGSEDGMIRVWDTRTRNITRVFRHSKGFVNNIAVIRRPPHLNPTFTNSKKNGSNLPLPLEKYSDSLEDKTDVKAFIGPQIISSKITEGKYRSGDSMMKQIKELEKEGSSVACEMEMERLKVECKRSMEMVQQWKKMYENLHDFCVGELVNVCED